MMEPINQTAKQQQNNRKRKRRKKEENIMVEAAVWPTESHSLSFRSFIFSCKCSLLLVIRLGLWLLPHY